MRRRCRFFGFILAVSLIAGYLLFEEFPPLSQRQFMIGDPGYLYSPDLGAYRSKSANNKILLVSYMRSGSTFTSEIIRHSGHSFLVFEPFWGICRKEFVKRRSSWKAVCRDEETEVQSIQKVSEVLHNIFSCNFNQLPVEVLTSFWFFPQGTGHAILNKCYNFHMNNQNNASKVRVSVLDTRARCVNKLEAMCKNSISILIKTIRISFDIFPKVVSKIPDIKIIHLLRDPRAIIHSRRELGYVDYRKIKNVSYELCTKMVKNINNCNHVLQRNVFILKFECLAAYPIIVTESLYTYLNLEFTNETHSWLITHTKGKAMSFRMTYTVNVADSLLVSLKWMTQLPKNILSSIDQECQEVYKHLNIPNASSLKERLQYNITFGLPNFYSTMCNA
ncbi:carbohydrate sulfotransferase 4-like [Mytilus edulis]|uniref:carbohydrate sulfotransferase 4-like n=1 Tax=Mytilus edulis TaxID=6550 RepID=UPI0039F07DE8